MELPSVNTFYRTCINIMATLLSMQIQRHVLLSLYLNFHRVYPKNTNIPISNGLLSPTHVFTFVSFICTMEIFYKSRSCKYACMRLIHSIAGWPVRVTYLTAAYMRVTQFKIISLNSKGLVAVNNIRLKITRIDIVGTLYIEYLLVLFEFKINLLKLGAAAGATVTISCLTLYILTKCSSKCQYEF